MISGIGCIVAAILRVIDSTYGVGDVLSWVFMLVPSDCLTNALFRKRMNLYKRNFKGLFVEILIPIILVLIGIGF